MSLLIYIINYTKRYCEEEKDNCINAGKELGMDITDWKSERIFWWDHKVAEYLSMYGAPLFSQIDIWDCHWNAINVSKTHYRGGEDKLLLTYLRITTRLIYRKGFRKLVRLCDKILVKWTH